MIFDKEDYKAFDPELWNAIDAEAERQQNNIPVYLRCRVPLCGCQYISHHPHR